MCMCKICDYVRNCRNEQERIKLLEEFNLYQMNKRRMERNKMAILPKYIESELPKYTKY